MSTRSASSFFHIMQVGFGWYASEDTLGALPGPDRHALALVGADPPPAEAAGREGGSPREISPRRETPRPVSQPAEAALVWVAPWQS